jgi:hypothetical protein
MITNGNIISIVTGLSGLINFYGGSDAGIVMMTVVYRRWLHGPGRVPLILTKKEREKGKRGVGQERLGGFRLFLVRDFFDIASRDLILGMKCDRMIIKNNKRE